jgi:hypothetical protein
MLAVGCVHGQFGGHALATASMKPLASAAITTLGGSMPLAVSTLVATYSEAEPMKANIMEPFKEADMLSDLQHAAVTHMHVADKQA